MLEIRSISGEATRTRFFSYDVIACFNGYFRRYAENTRIESVYYTPFQDYRTTNNLQYHILEKKYYFHIFYM